MWAFASLFCMDTSSDPISSTLSHPWCFLVFFSWPFVTIPDFDVRAGKVKEAANGFIINTYAYVLDEQREEWENYTSTHNQWVEEAIQIQAEDPSYTGPNPTEYEVWNVIHGYDEFDKENPGEFGTNRTGKLSNKRGQVLPFYWYGLY